MNTIITILATLFAIILIAIIVLALGLVSLWVATDDFDTNIPREETQDGKRK